MTAIGQLAPDFQLPNQDGELVRLSEFRGKKVVIFAFPKAFTLGCNAQACSFRDEFPRLQSSNAVVLGISADTPETLKAWKQNQKLQYDLLSDPDHRVLDAWDAWGMPVLGALRLPVPVRSFWVIDENGVIVDAQVGITPAASVERALKAVEGMVISV